VRKARRADAVDATTTILQAQERCRSTQPAYAGSVSALATCISGSATALGTSKNGYYTMTVSQTGTTPLAAAYTITATAVSSKGQQNDTGCSTMTVNVSGGNPTYTPASCWSR
jgi:type IV pilus assembly protein PilE